MADLSKEDLELLKGHLESVKNFLPSHLMNQFWAWCNIIRDLKTPQPCSCKSSAKHWGSCVEELRKYVKERE
jgi:hypothetical protein